MGFLSWWSEGNKMPPSSSSSSSSFSPVAKPPVKSDPPAEVPGMNGAVEVLRSPPVSPADVTVMEFGSVSASTNKVTLAGYCPVSNDDDIDPCRWEILPADADEAPQLRIVW